MTDYKKKELGAELGRMNARLREIAKELDVKRITVNQHCVQVDYTKEISASVWNLDGEDFENLFIKQPDFSETVLTDELEEACEKWGFEFPIRDGRLK